MKIECDKCGAKYSIADDKVRGKTFKIRCKKCSNVIIVRDKAGGDAAESEAPADEPGWHLAIGGETVGPLTESEVRERYAAGEIDRETSVWQEGFEDWLPLGDVGTFSDLTAGGAGDAAAAAPDPFAGAGEDDYGSPSGGGGGYSSPEPARAAEPVRAAEPARAAAVAATPVAASPSAGKGDSPRVSQLTSTRNENSVLFSLDSLSSMAMGSGKPSGGGGGSSPSPSSFSTPIGGGGGGGSHSPSAQGNSEGSGLIDIRSMGAMLSGGGGGGGGGEDDRDDSMLPSFGGTGFGGLAAAPLLSAAAPATAAAEPVAPEPQRSQAPLYAIIAILVLGLGGLAAFVLTRPPPAPEKIVERVIQAAPVPVDKNDKDDDKKKDDKADKEEDGDEGAAAEAGDAAAVDDKKGTVKKTDKKGTAVKTDVKKTDGKTDTKPEEPKKVDAKPKEEDISVECLLDPSKCKKGGGGGGGGSKPPPDSGLPEKLELADIKAGTDPTKAAAKSNCAGKAKGGEKVKIKLSIAGPSGTVLSSTPEDDGGNAPLGQCVAAELKKSTFKKVQKEQIGTVVSVSF